MKKVLIIGTILGLLGYLTIMWVLAEQDVDKMAKDQGTLQTKYDILKINYGAEHTMLVRSRSAFIQASRDIVALQDQTRQQQAKIDDLERQVQSARASRSQRRLSIPPDQMGADFWRRLANCENPDGKAPGGFFQFMGDTREKVGWAPGQSYETQRGEAIWWANQIHPNEDSTSGWPHCWNVALRG